MKKLPLLLLFVAGLAHAQGNDTGGMPPPPPDTGTTTTLPDTGATTETGTTTTTSTTTETPTTSTVPPPPPAAVEPVERRPTGFAIGIGLGYDLPTDIQQPNVTSVRFRLGSGLTIEPRVVIGFSTQKVPNGAGTDTTKSTEIGAAADVRYPHQIHGPVDLVLVGGAGFDRSSTNPPGSGSSSTLAFDLSWGLGLEYWFSPHWSISATAENPIVVLSSTTDDNGTGMTQTTSTTTLSAEWSPNVLAFVHLYL